MNITEFKKKYGTKSMGLAIEKLVEMFPEEALAQEKKEPVWDICRLLGEMVADLEFALESEP